MAFMRNNDRIESIFKVLGRGWASDPEKLAEFEETREVYDAMVRLDLLRQGKIKSFHEKLDKKPKRRAFPFPQEDTFVRGDR
jgi:hypothetical protein